MLGRERQYSTRWHHGKQTASAKWWTLVQGETIKCDLAPVQKLASAFLYISHTSRYFMGNIQNRSGFSSRSGSATWIGPTILAEEIIYVSFLEGTCAGCLTLREAGAWSVVRLLRALSLDVAHTWPLLSSGPDRLRTGPCPGTREFCTPADPRVHC